MDEQMGRRSLYVRFADNLAGVRRLLPLDLLLVTACWLMLAASGLLVALLPTRLILMPLGRNVGAVVHAPTSDRRQQGRALRIGRAIAAAASHAPFRADCYPQALVAAQLCRWLGIPHAVHLGARFAARDGDRFGKLEGHAWVSSGASTICGGSASDRCFATVACFVHDPRPASRDADA